VLAEAKAAGVDVDRKMLADLAVRDGAAFGALVTVASEANAGQGGGGAAPEQGAAAS